MGLLGFTFRLLGACSTLLTYSYAELLLPSSGPYLTSVVLAVALSQWAPSLCAEIAALTVLPALFWAGPAMRGSATVLLMLLTLALWFNGFGGAWDQSAGDAGRDGAVQVHFAPWEAEIRQALWKSVPQGWKGVGVVQSIMQQVSQAEKDGGEGGAERVLRRVERFTPTPVKKMSRSELERATEERIERRLNAVYDS